MATDPNIFLQNLVGASGLQNPATSFMAGQQQGLQNMQAQQGLDINAFKLAEAQRQSQQAQQYDTDVAAALSGNPNDLPNAIFSLALKYPDQAESMRKGWVMKDNAVRTADLRFFGELEASLRSGRTDLAIRTAEARLDAEKRAGLDTSDEMRLIDALKSGDKDAIQATRLTALANIAAATGPEDFAKTYEVTGEASGNKGGFTLGPGYRRFDAEGNLIAEAPYKPETIKVGEGETVVEHQPGGGGQSSGSGPSGSAASALRTNPGALKDGPFARSQPGYSGSSGGFATFDTPEQGRAAQMRLLKGSYIDKGYNTPRKIVERYAPRGPENSDASVNNYAKYIADKLGIGVDDVISGSAVPRLAQAMQEFETGNRPGGNSGGSRVIAQGAPRAQEWETVPADQVPSGLDQGMVYQRNVKTGEIKPVGGQRAAQLKPVPAQVVTKVLDNRRAIRNIDGAVKAIDQYPNGIGVVVGNTPTWISQRTDPDGVGVRSAIANIGSLLIHDRSGAAVTIAETPRLLPFVPLVSDDPKTAKTKLDRLRREIAAMNADYELQYSEDQGYRPMAQAADAPSGTPVRVRSLQEARKLPAGTIFIDPNGVRRRR